MRKLFSVKIVTEIIMLAENEKDVYSHALSYGEEEYNNSAFVEDIQEVNDKMYFPEGWEENCLPYGIGKGEKEFTIGEFLNKEKTMPP